jgi:hypothetical protein
MSDKHVVQVVQWEVLNVGSKEEEWNIVNEAGIAGLTEEYEDPEKAMQSFLSVSTEQSVLNESGQALDHFRNQVLQALGQYIDEAREYEDPEVQDDFDLVNRFQDFVKYVNLTNTTLGNQV